MNNKHIIEQRRQVVGNIYNTLQEDESVDRTPLTDGVYVGTQTGEIVSFKKGDVEFQFKSPIKDGDGSVVVLVQGKSISVQKEEVVKSNSPDFYGANCHVKQLSQNIHLQKSFGSDLTHQMFLHDLEKGGKRAVVGETRVYNGEKWVKHTDGWVHVSDRTGKTRVHQNDGKVVEGGAEHTSHYKTHIDRHEREQGNQIKQSPWKSHPDMTSQDHFRIAEQYKEHSLNKENSIQERRTAGMEMNKHFVLGSRKNEITREHLNQTTKTGKDGIHSHESVNKTTRYSIPGESKEDFHNRILDDVEVDKRNQHLLDRQSTNLQNAKEIGKTTSGKTVYEDGSELEQDEDWDDNDHYDATKLHFDEHAKRSNASRNFDSVNGSDKLGLKHYDKMSKEKQQKYLESLK